MPVLYGVFLYMGVASLNGVQVSPSNGREQAPTAGPSPEDGNQLTGTGFLSQPSDLSLLLHRLLFLPKKPRARVATVYKHCRKLPALRLRPKGRAICSAGEQPSLGPVGDGGCFGKTPASIFPPLPGPPQRRRGQRTLAEAPGSLPGWFGSSAGASVADGRKTREGD